MSARRPDRSGQRGQAVAEFGLLAPMLLFVLVLIFTGSQYMSTVVGMNGAARAGALVASNYMTGQSQNGTGGGTQATALVQATSAVNNEWGCASCFSGVASQAACSPTAAAPGCVWVDNNSTAPSSRHLETVHISYRVSSYIALISNLSVSANAAAEYR